MIGVFESRCIGAGREDIGSIRATRLFGVLYAGRDLATAFLEVFGDKIRHSRRLARTAIERYDVYAVKTAANLNVIALEATNLAKIGATLGCFSGSYPLSQRCGAVLMQHPDRIDELGLSRSAFGRALSCPVR